MQGIAARSRTLRLKVWGRNACFTRPEMKVERVSYDVMTPSAARGVLEAILWKPAISWRITQIDVLNPIKWESVRRNEIGAVVSPSVDGIFIEDRRQQRAGLFLRDVAYTIHAFFEMTEKAGPADSLVKFEEMFLRRSEKGQCFHHPYMGCREFPADFTPVQEGSLLPGSLEKTAELGFGNPRDLGYMLYDIFHDHSVDINEIHLCSDKCQPRFFKAVLDNGKISIPSPASLEVRG